VASAAKSCDGTVGGEEVGGEVVWRAAHDGHLGGDVEAVDVVRAVGLAQHAVDVVGEVVELEAEVEVREAVVVVLGDAVVVDPGVLGGDGHDVGDDAEDAPELDDDGVDARGAGDGQGGSCGR